MESSDRDTKLLFKLIKNQRASSTADTQILRVEHNESTTPAEINETFRNHFANLVKPKQNLKFNEEHDRQVKIDAELIINICENSSVTIQPVTPTEISKLVATLKKKKAEDIDNLTAEHLQYGVSTISDYLASTIKNIFYTKYVPDSIKKGLLMAVPKKDKDQSNPSNYRGITVISIICKLLEMCIRARIEGTLEKQQNKLQKVFTKGTSSINISLLMTEYTYTPTKVKHHPIFLSIYFVYINTIKTIK
jgi:hypothetical protein